MRQLQWFPILSRGGRTLFLFFVLSIVLSACGLSGSAWSLTALEFSCLSGERLKCMVKHCLPLAEPGRCRSPDFGDREPPRSLKPNKGFILLVEPTLTCSCLSPSSASNEAAVSILCRTPLFFAPMASNVPADGFAGIELAICGAQVGLVLGEPPNRCARRVLTVRSTDCSVVHAFDHWFSSASASSSVSLN